MPIVNAMLLRQSRNVRTLQHPATIATIILARPPLGSLVVRLITGDAIKISGVGHLGVAIQSLIEIFHFRRAILDLEQVAPLVDGGWAPPNVYNRRRVRLES